LFFPAVKSGVWDPDRKGLNQQLPTERRPERKDWQWKVLPDFREGLGMAPK